MQDSFFHPFHFNRSCHFFRVCPDYFFSSRFLMPYKIGFIKHTTIKRQTDNHIVPRPLSLKIEILPLWSNTKLLTRANPIPAVAKCESVFYSIHLIKSVENATNGIMRDTDSGITDKDEKSIINTFAHYKIVLIF